MTAQIVPAPGTPHGPCAESCEHSYCKYARAYADNDKTQKPLPPGTAVWRIEGPLFFANAEKLLALRKILEEGIPDEPLYGYVPLAGITKGFVPATARR